VVILEKMDAPGMKLLASGGSRCNVTNALEIEDFARRFGKTWRFLLPALRDFHGETLLKFFERNGVPLELTDGFHYFPRSAKSRDVLELFLDRILAAGGKLFCGRKAVSVTADGDCIVKCSDGAEFSAKSLVLACGGRGYPALGGSMAGYALAETLGHTVTPIYPAMTGVVCSDPAVGECAGISLADCAKL
jgi:predicted Rossmann fold flavoprotein